MSLKNCLIVILFLLSQASYAQPFKSLPYSLNRSSGAIAYRQKISLSNLDIQTDTLRFNRTASIFRWNTARYVGQPGLRFLNKNFPNAESGGALRGAKPKIYYGSRVNLYDTKKDSLFSLIGLKYINRLVYLKEKAPTIHWTIQDSTKHVGNYTARKAITHFRGRNYTAWFTPKIPVPYGPWKLHGLPGLILQAYSQDGNIYFSSTDIYLKDVKSIGPIALTGQEQKVKIAEYKNILDHYKQYQKQNLMKIIRQIKWLRKDDIANMQYHLQAVKHMEIFTDSTDQ